MRKAIVKVKIIDIPETEKKYADGTRTELGTASSILEFETSGFDLSQVNERVSTVLKLYDE